MSEDALQPLRDEIDRIDGEIIGLLNRRAACAVRIGAIKQARGAALYVPARERDVFARLAAANAGPLPDEALFRIYRAIMAAALDLEGAAVRMVGAGLVPETLERAVRRVAGPGAVAATAADAGAAIAFLAVDPSALLLTDPSWCEPLRAAAVEQEVALAWRGVWQPFGEPAIHLFSGPAATLPPRPATLCALLRKGEGIDAPPDGLADLGAVACRTQRLPGAPERVWLEMDFERTAAEIAEGPARQWANRCDALWIRP
jgi:chorismate mutase-like protein